MNELELIKRNKAGKKRFLELCDIKSCVVFKDESTKEFFVSVDYKTVAKISPLMVDLLLEHKIITCEEI